MNSNYLRFFIVIITIMGMHNLCSMKRKLLPKVDPHKKQKIETKKHAFPAIHEEKLRKLDVYADIKDLQQKTQKYIHFKNVISKLNFNDINWSTNRLICAAGRLALRFNKQKWQEIPDIIKAVKNNDIEYMTFIRNKCYKDFNNMHRLIPHCTTVEMLILLETFGVITTKYDDCFFNSIPKKVLIVNPVEYCFLRDRDWQLFEYRLKQLMGRRSCYYQFPLQQFWSLWVDIVLTESLSTTPYTPWELYNQTKKYAVLKELTGNKRWMKETEVVTRTQELIKKTKNPNHKKNLTTFFSFYSSNFLLGTSLGNLWENFDCIIFCKN